MSRMSKAVVQLGSRKVEVREFAVPSVGLDDALLRVERCGICGSDVEQFDGASGDAFSHLKLPVIPGHEPVGIIEEIGPVAEERWGIHVGDRVAVEAAVPCRSCAYCNRGEFNICPKRSYIGYVNIDVAPTLWGGYAEYMYLPPNALLHRISNDMPVDLAAIFNSFTCGIEWGALAPGTGLGDVVVVLGCGQRGLACALAAKAVGASKTIITGLTRDEHKLSLARELGIDHTVNVETENLHELVGGWTGGLGADVVVDVVPVVTSTFTDALDIVRPGGKVVLAGVKGGEPTPNFYSDRIAMKAINVIGVRGKAMETYDKAISLMESGRFALEKLATHTFGLDQVEDAIEILAGRVPGENGVFVALDPTR